MEAIGPIFELLKCLHSPIARRIGYAWNLRSNFEKLKKEVGVLYSARADITEKITRSGKVHTRQFQDWSDEAEEINNRVDRIEAVNELDNKCLNGCFPNVSSSRMKLGKEVVGLMERISNLNARRTNLDNFMVDPPTPPVETISAPDTKPGSSIDVTLAAVMESVKNSDILKIAILGMGGVGKTTLLKKLNNLPEIAELFQVVIWVKVSQEWNIRKVQNAIGRRLSLDLSSEISNDEVSRKIHTKMEKTRYLLLLDDVWENLNLEDVGIPVPNSDNGCKIVLTTRSRQVCKKMGTNQVIQVKVLSEVEAWELFCEKVGNNINNSPEIQQFARDVAKECAGLPLAIIVVGGALRDEGDVRVWRNALEELKSGNPSEMEDMEKKVFQRLQFSYNRLNSVNRKRCFLFGALYPEDYEIPIDELIEYWRASGFLDGAGSLSASYDKGHAILSHLINASLYEKDESFFGKDCIKMHDLVRDLALRITSMEGNKFLVRAGRIEHYPRDSEWKEFNMVSLMHTELIKLPESSMCRCCILSTLLLQHNTKLEVIPKLFFESTTALQVLDLSATGIKSLPPSICNLVNLRGLYLQDCDFLYELPSEIGALKRLEVLRLENKSQSQGIQYFPVEVGQLANLRCLNVSFRKNNSSRIHLPTGILSELSRLEDLRIYFKKGDKLWVSNVPEIIDEVCNLSALSHLSFTFPRLEQFESFIKRNEAWNNGILSSFDFIVNGSNETRNLTCNPPSVSAFGVVIDGRLTFENGDDFPDVIKLVLRRTRRFYLRGHKSVTRLSELGGENLMCLTYLEVESCHKIENVFSQGTIQHLTNLKELEIYHCVQVSEVIAGDAEYSAFPRLEKLTLRNLRNLESICNHVLAWSSIKEVDIHGCEKLRSLPFGSQNASTLREISCDDEWRDALRWEDDGVKAQLQYAFNDYSTFVAYSWM